MKNDTDIFNVFGDDFDRFAFPGEIYRVTAGHGGEAILIFGSDKTAILDCGMAYCGTQMVENVKKLLRRAGREKLDYAFLTHSHYDHIGALPLLRETFPEVVVYGSRHCRDVLLRPNAKKLIRRLGETARDLYAPESREEVSTDGLEVDVILEDGDEVSLGKEKLVAMETKGHTDCSLSYCLEPLRLLFASESTGIIEAEFKINTPALKSFDDALKSMEKCRAYAPDYICLPHFGMIPQSFNEKLWDMFREECYNRIEMMSDMRKRGLSEEEMLEEYKDRLWDPRKEQEQPIEAFLINAKNIIKAALRAADEGRMT